MPPDLETQDFLRQIEATAAPNWWETPLAEARERFSSFRQWALEPEPVPFVQDLPIEGTTVRWYRPQGSGPFGGLVYFHGGGWVLGGLDTLDGTLRRIANRSGRVVLSVDYRLAPENPFPAALDDACAVVRSVGENSADYEIEADRLAVGGDSAGGNLAAATCLRLRDEGGPKIERQLLVYPVMDATCDSPSYQEFAEGFGLTAETMRWFWRQYLPGGADGAISPYASPNLAPSLAGLPPATVLTAEYDVLRDEGERYAEQLAAAGVAVQMHRMEGLIHGFFHLAGVFAKGRGAVDAAADVLKKSD